VHGLTLHLPANLIPNPRRRFLLLTFGYTSCPDVCPGTLLAVHQALERLGTGAAWVLPIFVTVDPARDTRERLQAYVAGFDPRIRSISDPSAVRRTMLAFHARSAKYPGPAAGSYTVSHTAVLYVLDPGRRVIAALPEISPTLAGDLVDALRGSPAFPRDAAGS
jgi:protein SCO1